MCADLVVMEVQLGLYSWYYPTADLQYAPGPARLAVRKSYMERPSVCSALCCGADKQSMHERGSEQQAAAEELQMLKSPCPPTPSTTDAVPIMKVPFVDNAPCCGADLKVMREQCNEQQAAAEEQAAQLEHALAEAHLAGEEALLRLKETCAAAERQLQVVCKGLQGAGA